MANPRLQLFSGSCGSLVNVMCGTTGGSPVTMAAAGLTVGTTYYIRIYTTLNASGNFNICITDPTPPANDNCAGAVNLNSNNSCSNTPGTLLYSTPSSTTASCGTASSGDVWYKYNATTAYPTITLDINNTNTTIKAATAVLEIYSGASCAGLTSIGCWKGGPGLGNFSASPVLTVGATYYIRVYTNTNTGSYIGSGNWAFNICIVNPSASNPTVFYGKSYVNITKGSGGGTVEPGDELEIRGTFAVSANAAYFCAFSDNVPANTTYVPNTLRVLTNEGKIYQQFTDAAADDAGTIALGAVTINLGSGATAASGGAVRFTNRPSNFGTTCIMVASYRVIVNAVSLGTIVNMGGGTIAYRNQPLTPVNTITFPAYNAVVYKNFGICANTIGSNGVLSEFSGTFGSGNMKDRAASSKIPANYTYAQFSNGNPGDNFYGLSNNSSSGGVNYSINPNEPVAVKHVFNVWDIIGDHTGATNPLAGNPPADTTGGKTGGYMVVINAAFRTDTAFLDTVKNLCPNTYYEYSAWFRNICRTCGADSIGVSSSSLGYIPTGPGDSSGVHPNLTFNINGKDYYTTGDILYNGQWIKKGFTYLTGPAETQMIINIRNNAPGGGGNDWAVDDIGVATCTPNLVMNPATPTVNVCYGDGTSLSADVTSYFNNYTQYIWEKSTDNGVNWLSTGYSGTGSPLTNGTEFVYTAVGPSFIGDSSTHNNIFRLRVASTSINLADPSCSFSGIRTVKVYVSNCMWLLKANFVNFSGSLRSNLAGLQWKMVNENGKESYEIEKSTDGTHFTIAGKLRSTSPDGSGNYTFDDPAALNAITYYRIKLLEESGFKYSKTVMLAPGKIPFDVKGLVNPFSSHIQFDVIVPGTGAIKSTLFDNYGKVVKTHTEQAEKGVHAIKIANISNLTSGMYTLKVQWQNETLTKRIIKITE
ncbi:MAG: T9SS type A sorting domain-containing protein [Chitinophagaceae bacterium]